MDAVADADREARDLDAFLEPGVFVDSDNDDVIAFAEAATVNATSPRQRAIALYTAVRDKIRYDPYVAIHDTRNYRASDCLKAGRGFCIGKASLLAASARAMGIPSRVAFADVRNHLSTPRLTEIMGGTDVFHNHGFTELYIDGKWVKVTPTFNVELCEKFGVVALDFDGEQDALLHPYDRQGRRHMEYVAYGGSYADVPAEKIRQQMLDSYGEDVCEELRRAGGDFGAEAARDSTG